MSHSHHSHTKTDTTTYPSPSEQAALAGKRTPARPVATRSTVCPPTSPTAKPATPTTPGKPATPTVPARRGPTVAFGDKVCYTPRGTSGLVAGKTKQDGFLAFVTHVWEDGTVNLNVLGDATFGSPGQLLARVAGADIARAGCFHAPGSGKAQANTERYGQPQDEARSRDQAAIDANRGRLAGRFSGSPTPVGKSVVNVDPAAQAEIDRLAGR